jgi:hypothetical protein
LPSWGNRRKNRPKNQGRLEMEIKMCISNLHKRNLRALVNLLSSLAIYISNDGEKKMVYDREGMLDHIEDKLFVRCNEMNRPAIVEAINACPWFCTMDNYNENGEIKILLNSQNEASTILVTVF